MFENPPRRSPYGARAELDPTEQAAMPRHPSDQRKARPKGYGSIERRPPPYKRVSPLELATWLRDRTPELGARWSAEIRARGLGQGPEVDRVVERFIEELLLLLPRLLGPERALVEPVWVRACELFGTMSAKRGLAAGEVIEEFHILRELLIRELYADPPLGARAPLSLREILRLNRALDRGVTQASVGHTDAMFFQFFEEDVDEPAMKGPEILEQVEAELDAIVAELAEVGSDAAVRPGDGSRER